MDPDGLDARLLLEQLQVVAPEELGGEDPTLDEWAPRGARRWSHWVALLMWRS
jgi:hypothetical protein